MDPRGRLIVFEGGEGSGKSTQARLLADALDAVLTREPGGTAVGERIREVLLDRSIGHLDARAELLLMAAARAQHVAERIRPALESGRDVVCDRFAGSTLAYQGFGRGLPLAEVERAGELAADGLVADLTILLDLPAEIAATRRSGSPDRIEAEDPSFHEHVVAGFRSIAAADPKRWVVLNASADPERLHEQVLEALTARLGGPSHSGRPHDG